MNDRILSLRNKMAGLNLQGMIISNPTNVKYLTGLEAEGLLLLTRKENIYITDSRYIEYVSNTITPFDATDSARPPRFPRPSGRASRTPRRISAP